MLPFYNVLASMTNSQQNLFELETLGEPKEAIAPLDYFADLIWYILGLTVGAFFNLINYNLLQTTNTINNGKARLEDTLPDVDADVRTELQQISDNALSGAVSLIGELLYKLGRVLPSLTSTVSITLPGRMDPNDSNLFIVYNYFLGSFHLT